MKAAHASVVVPVGAQANEPGHATKLVAEHSGRQISTFAVTRCDVPDGHGSVTLGRKQIPSANCAGPPHIADAQSSFERQSPPARTVPGAPPPRGRVPGMHARVPWYSAHVNPVGQ